MGKKKGNKSESIGRKSARNAEKPNVFEQKYLKLKHKVIGKKMTGALRQPIDPKSESFKRRAELLLPELRNFGKVNSLVDKRLGEKDKSLSKEDKIARRFALERTRRLKKNLFKLGDTGEEETLTHFGQRLSDDIIERMDKPLKEEEEDDGVLGADFVQMAHFGGGEDEDPNETSDKPKSRKDLITEMIARAKLARSERQQTREKTLDLTEQLDAKWKEMIGSKALVEQMLKEKHSNSTNQAEETSDYDKLVKELMFERKGVPSDKLKSDVEVAKEELEKLERLEQERLKRMNKSSVLLQHSDHFNVDEDISDTKPTRKSGKKKVRFEVTYDQSGRLMSDEAVSREIESAKASLRQYKTATGAEDDEEISDDEDDDEEEESEAETCEESGAEDEDEEEEEEENGDVYHSAAEDQDEEMERVGKKGILKSKSSEAADENALTEEEIAKLTMDIPYLIEMPDSYEKLAELLKGKIPADQALVLERLMKNYHPGLKVGNKKKLKKLFFLLVRYLDSVAVERLPRDSYLQTIDCIVAALYQLATGFIGHAAKIILALLKRCRQKFLLNKKYFPDWNCFCLLKLIAVLFPTSDYSHPVVSPAFLFGTEILDSSRVQSVPDLTKGLMLCGILCDYVAESKLFIPGVNGFLQSAIWSLDSDVVDIKKRPCPTFLTSSLLSPNGKVTQQQIAQISISDVFGGRQTTEIMAEKLKISCTSMAVQLCLKFADMWKDLQSYEEIFKNITESCTRLNKDFYPESLRNDIDQLVIRLTANRAMVKRVPMRFESARIAGTKPQKEFKFLEPRIEANFNPEKSRRGGGKKGAAAERQRLVHVYKRELKGTVRELKRDSQFIARAELMEEKSRDERRKRKTKELMKSLMGQEGEYKKFKRMKSKK